MSIELNSDLGVFHKLADMRSLQSQPHLVAGICFVKLLLLIRPAVMIVQSDKNNTMFNEHRFIFDGTSALKRFVASQITLQQYCEQTATSIQDKFDEDCDSGDGDFSDYAESKAVNESPSEEIAQNGCRGPVIGPLPKADEVVSASRAQVSR